MPTYSTTVRSSSDDIVLDLQVRVEDRCVELGLAIEAVADALPVGGWLGHYRDSSVHAHVNCAVGGVWAAQVGDMEPWRWSELEATAGSATKAGLCRITVPCSTRYLTYQSRSSALLFFIL